MNIVIIMAVIILGAVIVFLLAALVFPKKKTEEKKDFKEEIESLEARQKEIYNKLLENEQPKKEQIRVVLTPVKEPVEEKTEEPVVEEVKEEPVVEEVKEEPVVEEVVEPVVEEAAEPVVGDIEGVEEAPVVEEKKKMPSKRRSFALKLASSTDATKKYFSEVTNKLRYYGMTARIGKSKVMFRINKEVYARMFFKGKRIVLALPLDPKDDRYDVNTYKQIDLSEKKGFENLGFGIRIANRKNVDLILDLIEQVAAKNDFVANEKFKEIDYVEKYPDTYTYFEKLGYGYLVKQEVRRDDVENFADEFADKIVKEQKIEDAKPSRFLKSEVSIQEFNNRYTDVETPVDMDRLKSSELIAKNCNYLIVKASSKIDKPFKVYAHEFEPDAVKMIFMAGGEAIKLVYKDEENK